MAKDGVIYSHISLIKDVVDSTFIDNHYDGILDTVKLGGDLETEDGQILQTESGLTLELESTTKTSTEVYTIPFVGTETIETEQNLV